MDHEREFFGEKEADTRGSPGGSGAREIVVTSPGARDGKSTTAGNLAVTFAQQGNRTLLVDADLRKSVQHRAFETPSEPGLSDLLVGDVGLAEAVHEARARAVAQVRRDWRTAAGSD